MGAKRKALLPCPSPSASLPLAFLLVLLVVSGSDGFMDFGDVEGIIAAFGDFNSDKFTDVFVIKQGLREFQVMTQLSPKDLPKSKQPFLRKSVSCKLIQDEALVALIPGDFHGNAMMDLVTVSSVPKVPGYSLRMLTGNTTTLGCNGIEKRLLAKVYSHPLMLDFNGDMISDLLLDEGNGKRVIWLGSDNGTSRLRSPFPKTANEGEPHQDIMDPNANAFVDLNGDGVADIYIKGAQTMEYWMANEKGYTHAIHFPHPDEKYKIVGQSTFLDINGDKKIDHIIPVCIEKSGPCSILVLRNETLKKEQRFSWEVLVANFTLTINTTTSNFVFSETKYVDLNNQLVFPITLRHGDVNGDGYPDLLTVMRPHDHDLVTLLQNVPSDDNDWGRSFSLDKKQPYLPSAPLVSAFFDIYEDSKVDVIASYARRAMANVTNPLKLPLNGDLNSQMFDANFLKILVTSGRCPNGNCYSESILQQIYRVSYGTNQPGPFVTFNLLDANGDRKMSAAGQLSQSGYFALQMPYLIFGLGSLANYIDEISVTVPSGNTSRIYSHIIEQLVPDAQVIVIPHPMENPEEWMSRLFLTPSDIIFKTLYTLLGICLGLLVVIAVLHKKHLMEDVAEKKDFRGQYLDTRR